MRRSLRRWPLRAARCLHLEGGEVGLISAIKFTLAEEAAARGLTVRVAGGWVRDKLLQAHAPPRTPQRTRPDAPHASVPDVDLVVDSMSGVEFACLLRDWVARTLARAQAQEQLLARGGDGGGDGAVDRCASANAAPLAEEAIQAAVTADWHGLGVVRRALGTAAIRAWGLGIDVTQARREAYDGRPHPAQMADMVMREKEARSEQRRATRAAAALAKQAHSDSLQQHQSPSPSQQQQQQQIPLWSASEHFAAQAAASVLQNPAAVGTRTPTFVAPAESPREDALRRDFTVNALFYNILTEQVEDFTGEGLRDLKARILRTPIAPLDTLLDDPLRALRAVRFSAKLGFGVVPELMEACKDPRTLDALLRKVSRERIGSEMELTMRSANPVAGALSMLQTGLLRVAVETPHSLHFAENMMADGVQRLAAMHFLVARLRDGPPLPLLKLRHVASTAATEGQGGEPTVLEKPAHDANVAAMLFSGAHMLLLLPGGSTNWAVTWADTVARSIAVPRIRKLGATITADEVRELRRVASENGILQHGSSPRAVMLIEFLVLGSLRFSAATWREIRTLLATVEAYIALLSKLSSSGPAALPDFGAQARSTLRSAFASWIHVSGPRFAEAMVIAHAMRVLQAGALRVDVPEWEEWKRRAAAGSCRDDVLLGSDPQHAIIREVDPAAVRNELAFMRSLLEFATTEGIEQAYNARPQLDGSEIFRLLDPKPIGDDVRTLLSRMMSWQFLDAKNEHDEPGARAFVQREWESVVARRSLAETKP